MITKVSVAQEAEAVFEKEIVQPVRKQRFTIKQIDAQIARLQAQIVDLEKDKTDALAIRGE